MNNTMGEQAGAAETRLGTLREDRACVGCGFNLAGQSVVREPHYRLTMVRCPECGQAAALQEYPTLGRWAGRWAAVLAAVWFIVLLAGLALTAMLMVGATITSTPDLLEDVGTRLVELHKPYLDEQVKKNPNDSTIQWLTQSEEYRRTMITTTWWNQQDRSTLRAQVGGPWGQITANGWRSVGGFALALFAVGLPWSMALIGLRGWRLALFAVLPAVGAGAVFATMRAAGGIWQSQWGWGLLTKHAAADLCGDGLAYVVIGLLAAPLALGLLAGRPLARFLARWLLTPRMQGSLGMLWTADGKAPPGGGKR